MVMDGLDHHLSGGDAAKKFLAGRPLRDFGDEILDHGERHVGFQQGDADFAHRFFDVGLFQGAALCQLVEDAAQAAG